MRPGFLIVMAMAFIYWAAPNAALPFRLYTPGAVLFTSAWLVMTYLLGLYVGNLGSYNATYGALGGVVVLLLWLYLTGFLILLGAEVNAALARQSQPEDLRQTSGRLRKSGSMRPRRGVSATWNASGEAALSRSDEPARQS